MAAPKRHELVRDLSLAELTHEILASTLEHVLRTFGAPGPGGPADASQHEAAREDAPAAER